MSFTLSILQKMNSLRLFGRTLRSASGSKAATTIIATPQATPSTKTPGIVTSDTSLSGIERRRASEMNSKVGKEVEKEGKEGEEEEDAFAAGPVGLEWNGPRRGGSKPEPTRYGDWERNGRAVDF